jgi:hypothetical protein
MTVEEIELRANAMIRDLAAQRNAAMDRCAALQADIAVLRARLEAAEKKNASG